MLTKAFLSQYSLLAKSSFGIRYTRQYLTSLDINHDLLQQQKNIIQQKQQKQAIFNLPYNDKNPDNIIKVRMNHPIHSINFIQPGLIKNCVIMEKQYPKPRSFISATRKYIITSIKKAKDAMFPLKKLHIFQAITSCEQSKKKVAKLMVRTLWNLINHALTHKKMVPIRLFIHGVIIGKTKRYYGVRYQAKGRGYRQKRDFCQVKIVCYQKPVKEFYQEIAFGDCAPGAANFIRDKLLRKNADLKTLTKYSFITTAKGRQQAKEIIRRRVDIKMKQNQEAGIFVAKKQILKDILQVQGKKANQLVASLFDVNTNMRSLLNREKLFKNNMQKN